MIYIFVIYFFILFFITAIFVYASQVFCMTICGSTADISENGSELGEAVDFIDMFLNAESSDIDLNATAGSSTFDRANSRVSRRLTIDEIAAQCFVFLIAGYDTTLGVTCYYLAVNPDVQERMREEIIQICPSREPTYEQINQLKYSDAVMKETLRLAPIAALWLNSDGENRPQLSWLPFGAGPRICIGMRLAYLEEKLMLVHILQKYRIVSCSQTELKLVGNMVLNPESVLIKLEKIGS